MEYACKCWISVGKKGFKLAKLLVNRLNYYLISIGPTITVCAVLAFLFFYLFARTPNFENFYIYSNKFFHNFHFSESSFTCPVLRASGLARRLSVYSRLIVTSVNSIPMYHHRTTSDLFTTTFSPYLLRFFTVNYTLRLNLTILRLNKHRFFKIRLYRKGHTVIDHSERHNF